MSKRPKAKSEFTAQQPKDGETIVHCAHVPDAPKIRWFKAQKPIRFTRPDGTSATTNWFACCDTCYTQANGDPMKVLFQGDSTWIGSDPAIRKETMH